MIMKRNGSKLIASLHKIAEEVEDYDKAIRIINAEVQRHNDLDEVLLHLHYKGVVLSAETVDLVTDKFKNRK